MTTFSPEETLIGGYNFEEREIQTRKNLSANLDNIIKDNIHSAIIAQFYANPEPSTKKKKAKNEGEQLFN